MSTVLIVAFIMLGMFALIGFLLVYLDRRKKTPSDNDNSNSQASCDSHVPTKQDDLGLIVALGAAALLSSQPDTDSTNESDSSSEE